MDFWEGKRRGVKGNNERGRKDTGGKGTKERWKGGYAATKRREVKEKTSREIGKIWFFIAVAASFYLSWLQYWVKWTPLWTYFPEALVTSRKWSDAYVLVSANKWAVPPMANVVRYNVHLCLKQSVWEWPCDMTMVNKPFKLCTNICWRSCEVVRRLRYICSAMEVGYSAIMRYTIFGDIITSGIKQTVKAYPLSNFN